MKLLFVVLLSSLGAITPLRAHEVQPTVMDLALGSERLEITAHWMVEAAVAGLDLEAIEDTQNAENDGEYDRLRGLEPEALQAEIRAAWDEISAKIDVLAGEARLPLSLESIDVPEVANIEIARLSTLRITVALPPGNDPVTIGWTPDLGPLIVRQYGVENGYSAFLAPGGVSDPIPREGGSAQSASAAFGNYVGVGFDHIVPQGLDHILFVLGLFFFSLRMGALLWQVTAFTLAHTLTLALGALDIIRIPADIVEPLIAASIVYVGIENIFLRNMPPWRPVVVFCFGLLHGLGFAAVLQDFGLGADNFLPKLIGFNVGVEIGQIAVIAAAWLTLAFFFGRFDWYHRRIAAPVSLAIALVAAFWVLERTGMIGTGGTWGLFTALTEGGFPAHWITAGALAVGAVLTGLEMLAITQDRFREVAGMLTSFLLFLAIIATFTSGAWIMALVLAAAWVLLLRLQSLGEPKDALV